MRLAVRGSEIIDAFRVRLYHFLIYERFSVIDPAAHEGTVGLKQERSSWDPQLFGETLGPPGKNLADPAPRLSNP